MTRCVYCGSENTRPCTFGLKWRCLACGRLFTPSIHGLEPKAKSAKE